MIFNNNFYYYYYYNFNFNSVIVFFSLQGGVIYRIFCLFSIVRFYSYSCDVVDVDCVDRVHISLSSIDNNDSNGDNDDTDNNNDLMMMMFSDEYLMTSFILIFK